jgi:inorganic pyrophosphatase
MGYPFNALTPFPDNKSHILTVIELPKGSMLKIEWQRAKEYFILDRVEPQIFAKPVNYGFIPQTLDHDGDELDTLVVTAEPIPTGVVVEEARVIGVMYFNDGGEVDNKIVCVPASDLHYGKIEHINELGDAWKKQIEHHFNHYKDLKKPGSTEVTGFAGPEEAWKIIDECREIALSNPWWA